MPKINRLKGLPNTITQQFFSTTFYYSKGYMADWVFNAASEKNVSELKIDFWNNTITPNELEIKPILRQLPRLKETVHKTLKSQNFEPDFITKGFMEIRMGKTGYRYLYCKTILIDKNGIEHIGKEYTESVYEENFKVFRTKKEYSEFNKDNLKKTNESILERIKNIFR
ncbi:hypothetical protein [Psychroserpens sp. SPM9]|uniref:hypothetical protein n=1 Tax=Psychroserpens sp. SPM9 TaxID=2975598 RepID=UPI0021A4B03E|nr:hypothetical protein [Psychroserpens sp. SPM9]MDG5493197.1 hypothetical protein [Psychroserpens sp. SPM9]